MDVEVWRLERPSLKDVQLTTLYVSRGRFGYAPTGAMRLAVGPAAIGKTNRLERPTDADVREVAVCKPAKRIGPLAEEGAA